MTRLNLPFNPTHYNLVELIRYNCNVDNVPTGRASNHIRVLWDSLDSLKPQDMTAQKIRDILDNFTVQLQGYRLRDLIQSASWQQMAD